jgi:Zn-dependent peptidase ImmA (M78 family)/DNA-binding XRE family transcriptional regulator
MATKESVAEAVRAAREALGFTQQKLAELSGFANLQTVSDIERGQREVRSWELVKIASALHTTVAALLDTPTGADLARVFWRRGGLAAHRPEVEAVFRERVRRYADLERLCGVGPAALLPDIEIDPEHVSYAEAERLANEVSRTLDLGSRPASGLTKVLETRYRVKIFYEDLGEGESAACVRDAEGAAILMNRTEPPWRRNYNFAHELFHLVTWSAVDRSWLRDGEPDWYASLEKVANSFAAVLLLPASEVHAEVARRLESGELEDADLIDIARDFDVSTDALVWRLVNLRFMTEEQARTRLSDPEFRRRDRMSMRGLWTEPDAGLPERYRRLARLAFDKGVLSRTRAATYLEQSPADLYELEWGEVGEEAATAAP